MKTTKVYAKEAFFFIIIFAFFWGCGSNEEGGSSTLNEPENTAINAPNYSNSSTINSSC